MYISSQPYQYPLCTYRYKKYKIFKTSLKPVVRIKINWPQLGDLYKKCLNKIVSSKTWLPWDI